MTQSYRNSHTSKEISQNYDAKFSYRLDSLIWREFVKPYLSTTLKKIKEEGAKDYMDFASGTGRILKVGHHVFGSSTAIDISKNMLDVAKERVPEAQFYCLDVTKNDTSNIGLFDCVTMFRFIRNAEPELRESVLAWLSQHMSSGATLIVNNHGHSASLQSLIVKLAFWLPADAKNLLSRKETYMLLEKAGFSVISCSGFHILPSLFGRPVFGHYLQSKLENLAQKIGLSRFGAELVIVAKRK